MTAVQGPEHVKLGRAVRRMRIDRELSQEALGRASRLHRNYVGAVERGEINPTFRVLMKVASGLDAPLSEAMARYERTSLPGVEEL